MATMIIKNSGKMVSEDYTVKVLKVNNIHLGMTFVENGNLNTLSFSADPPEGEKKYDLPTTFREMQDALKDVPAVIFLDNHPKLPKDEWQPFECIKDEEGLQVAVFVSGEFPQYADEKDHSAPFLVFRDTLDSKIKSNWLKAGEDTKVFFDLMTTTEMRGEMVPLLRPHGLVIMQLKDGREISYGIKNDSARTMDFGWVSDELKTVDAKPAVDTSKMTIKQKAALLAAGSVEVEAPESNKKDETEVETKPDVTTGDPESVAPPKELTGKPLRQWYHQNQGELPNGWEKRPPIPFAKLVPGSPLRTVKSFKDIPPDTATKGNGTTPPLIPGDQRKTVIEKILPRIQLLEAADIQAQETKWPSFTKQTAYDKGLNGVLRWSDDDRLKICRSYPQTGAVIMRDLTYLIINLKPELLQEAATANQEETTGKGISPKLAAKML